VNVLFFTSWYPTAAHTYSGVFVREHAKAVRSAGHEVVVLHLAGPHLKRDRRLWAMEEERDPALSEGIDTYHVFHRSFGLRGASYAPYLQSAIGAYRRLRDGGFRPDLIHAHIYTAGVPAAGIGTRSGIPVVLTEHFSGFPRRTLNLVEVRKARYAYKRVARALPVSRHLMQAIASYGIDRPFEIVPNVVDTSLFYPRRRERREQSARRRLLFVGSLEPLQSKGFPTLLRALVRLNDLRQDWRLDVFGDGPHRKSNEASVVALGLEEQVTFHGSRPKAVVAQMMRASDLFVLPSRFENLPCAIVEALASGLPVVSTTVGGIPELVDGRSGRLVPPDDPIALADALGSTLENLDAFDCRAIAAAAAYRYGLEVVGRQLTRIYDAVLAGQSLDVSSRSATSRADEISPPRGER
jgi:glycosyltransferase involved in cell wall biosynthesis